jgi:hypothetical protein
VMDNALAVVNCGYGVLSPRCEVEGDCVESPWRGTRLLLHAAMAQSWRASAEILLVWMSGARARSRCYGR